MSLHDDPHVGPRPESPLEFTVKTLVLGLILAVVMGAANTYLALYAGMTVSASIPAAVISMAILRGLLRRGTILENNMTQTIASAGESLAGGAVFTLPALIIVGAWQDFRFWPTTLIVMLGGLLGIVFMVPMRRAFIAGRPDLAYPEGVACSEVLRAGQEGGAGALAIGIGLFTGVVFKVLVNGIGIIRHTVEGAFAAGRSVFYAGADMSVALLAVGYIVNVHIAGLVFLGGAVAWFVFIPLLGGYQDGLAADAAWDIWSTQVRFVGVGAMLVGGIHSIFSVRRGIWEGVRGLRGVAASGGDAAERTEQDLPLPALLVVFGGTALATFLLYSVLVESMWIGAVAAVIMIVAAFLFVAVATYIVGLVGSSHSPVSGMTICALLIAAGVLLVLGVQGNAAIFATLGVAGVVCCAACTSGDVAQDLKTGRLVGATPRKQQFGEIIGVVVSAFVFAPVLNLLNSSYGIATGEPGALRAPQAALFASLTQGFFGDDPLPWNMLGLGVLSGLLLIAFNFGMKAAGKDFRAHVMPVAVGMYLPLSLSVPIFLGGLLRAFFGPRSNGRPETVLRDTGVLFGSGLIAGEALTGIGLAVPATLGKELPLLPDGVPGGTVVSLVLFAGVIVFYGRMARIGAGPGNG